LATEESLEKTEARLASSETYVSEMSCLWVERTVFVITIVIMQLMLLSSELNVKQSKVYLSVVYVSCCFDVSSNKQLKQDIHTLMAKLKQQQQSSETVSLIVLVFQFTLIVVFIHFRRK